LLRTTDRAADVELVGAGLVCGADVVDALVVGAALELAAVDAAFDLLGDRVDVARREGCADGFAVVVGQTA
jgi:hypothetical protein